MAHPQYIPFDETIPNRGACPNGCDALVTGIDWKDEQEHLEDARCTRCGAIWQSSQEET